MAETDPELYYNVWCDGSCYHTSSENWMGMGIYYIETNTQYPTPVVRKMAVAAPKGDHNIAEYLAILCALTDIYILQGARRTDGEYITMNRQIIIHSDSQIVIRQLQGEYAVRKKNMQYMYDQVQDVLLLLDNLEIAVEFKWNPRDTKNQQVADWLSKVGNKYFKDITADDTITHGVTDISEFLLPKSYRTIRRRFKWPSS